jgi:hypothetical protein
LFAKWNFDKLFKGGIESAKKKFAAEVENSSTSTYAIISAACAWLLAKYRDHDFNVDDKEVNEAIHFVYDTFIYLMLYPNTNIRRNTRPLLVAGTKYIHMFQKAVGDTFRGKKVKTLLNGFICCMKEGTDCDYLFLDLLVNVLGGLQLSADEKAKVEEAKNKLKYEF